MLTDLSNFLSTLVPKSHDLVIAKDKSHIYSNMKYKGTRYFISSIKDAVSTPSLIRGFHRNMTESNPFIKWRRLIDDVIRSAYRLFVDLKGLDNAEQWQIDAINGSQKTLAARGPIGFFEEGSGYSWIVKEERDEKQYDVLLFRHGNDSNDVMKIAERDNYAYLITEANKGGNRKQNANIDKMPLGYDGMEVIDERFRELFHSLQYLHSNWAHDTQRTHHHLFFWSNDKIETYQSTFVKEALQRYLSSISNEYMFSVQGLILCRTDSNLQSIVMSSLERLSLKRVRPGSIFLISEGSDKMSKKSIKKYLSSVGIEIDYMHQTRSEISIHECQIETKNATEVAIIFPIWDGMWKESRDIDGEQIIFDH